MPGLFIAFEGIDGSGKTTIAREIAPRMQACGIPTLYTFEHTRGIIGQRIHDILEGRAPMIGQHELQTLFVQDRKEHLALVIEPALAKDIAVICDRYWLSTIAYSMLFSMPETFITLHEQLLGKNFLRPSLTFLIDVSPHTALARMSQSRSITTFFEKEEKLQKLRDHYLSLAYDTKLGPITIIDGEQGLSQCIDDVWSVLLKNFSRFFFV